MFRLTSLTLLVALGICSAVPILKAEDWPQLQHDPQRTGYTPERLQPPFALAWVHNFQPERVRGSVQPVIHQGRVFVGTEAGNLYALDAATGKDLWKYACGSAILHTAACNSGRVFFASLDGSVYALKADSGEVIWKFSGQKGFGFTTSPLIADNKLFIGQRNGTFYALGLEDGKPIWTYDAGAPIFNTAAFHPKGLVIFGGEDMKMQALDAATGKPVWASEEIFGQSMKGTHPVIVGDTVIIRPMMNHLVRMMSWPPDFTPTWDQAVLKQRLEEAKQLGVLDGKMPEKLLKLQDEVEKYYQDNPREQDLFMLEAATGKKLPVAPHFRVNSMHGPVAPPAVDSSGAIIIPWTYINHGWARMDLAKRRVVEFMVPPRPTNADEQITASVAGNLVFIFHCEEANANHTGIYDLEKKQWLTFPAPPDRWGAMADNLQTASHAVSVADGRFYHIVFHQLAAWNSAGASVKEK